MSSAATVAGAGETVTDAGAPGKTLTYSQLLNPATLAVTAEKPIPTAVSTPVWETVRTLGSLLDHVTG
ncbi:MAG: hypothetical protein DMD53_14445 [Gemmatimonadetes bacterium]|nr:MAG: hypothetical protein DMD53_14445 [Gemmatimonadota bacterium]